MDKKLQKAVKQNIGIITDIHNKIKTDIHGTLNTSTTFDNWTTQIGTYTNTNIIISPAYLPYTQKFIENIGKTYDMVLTVPTPETDVLKNVIQNHTMDYVTNVGEDIKQQLRNILDEGLNQKLSSNDIVHNMTSKVEQINQTRGNMIARTETMRAGNISQWYENQQEGMGYYTIDSASDCCPICEELYGGAEFTIDDLDWLPPLHPNCACVAVFHRNQSMPEERLMPTGLDVNEEIKATRESLKQAKTDSN